VGDGRSLPSCSLPEFARLAPLSSHRAPLLMRNENLLDVCEFDLMLHLMVTWKEMGVRMHTAIHDVGDMMVTGLHWDSHCSSYSPHNESRTCPYQTGQMERVDDGVNESLMRMLMLMLRCHSCPYHSWRQWSTSVSNDGSSMYRMESTIIEESDYSPAPTMAGMRRDETRQA